MCTGKRFHLKSEILCIEETECGRVAVTIPAGEVLMVLNGPPPDDRRMVEIEWVSGSSLPLWTISADEGKKFDSGVRPQFSLSDAHRRTYGVVAAGRESFSKVPHFAQLLCS